MGIGPNVLRLYCQLKREGIFDNVKSVMEFGSQEFSAACKGHESAVYELARLFGVKNAPAPVEVAEMLDCGPAKPLYEMLGLSYASLDTDGRHGALPWDLNFVTVTPEHGGKYGFVTNHGTTEHLINQWNAFKVAHDLTSVGGYMLHCLPFMNYLDHGFFSYHPNFFYALATANGYDVLGPWVTIDDSLNHYIPYDQSIFKYINQTGNSTMLVILRKTGPDPFATPFQGVYESSRTTENAARYITVSASARSGGYETDLSNMVRRHFYRAKKVVVFGASSAGKAILRQLKTLKFEIAITDNNPAVHGAEIEGIKVVAPDTLKGKGYYVIIASQPGYHEISRQLVEMGYSKYADFADYRLLPELM
ncbi:MAG: hypothetical protein HY751_02495 [Nitrospinae bacterium]|nr:hypothetical protein [Nitrospinota bacterium]